MRKFTIPGGDRVQDAKEKLLINLPYWIAAATAVVVAVAYAKVFALGEDWALSQAQSPLIYIIAPAGIICSFLIGHFFSKESIGSGIPQVIAAAEIGATESTLFQKLLSIRMIVFKLIGSWVCALGGGSTGREGPTLHISAGVFYQVSRLWPKKWSRPDNNFMVMAGGAAGLAAAFNTPLGGVVFAIEEISKSHISQIRTTVFQAVIIAGIISQMFLGDYLYLGNFLLMPASTSILCFQSVVIAALVGACGAMFGETLYLATIWRARQTFMKKFLMTLVCAGIFSSLIYFLGTATLGGGKGFMISLLSDSEQKANVMLPLARVLGNLFTYISGVIGGIFAPALASGAALAHFLSQSFGFLSLKIMMLVGMVAFLSALSRTPFTSFVLVLEMSDSHEVVLYLMISSFVAAVIGKLMFKKGFYEKIAQGIVSQHHLENGITPTTSPG